MKSLNVFNYTDYRQYLIEYYDLKKAENPRFSYGVWTRLLDLKSTTTLCKILSGVREPSQVTLEKLVEYFEFNTNEKVHFFFIVQLSGFIKSHTLSELKMNEKGITITY